MMFGMFPMGNLLEMGNLCWVFGGFWFFFAGSWMANLCLQGLVR